MAEKGKPKVANNQIHAISKTTNPIQTNIKLCKYTQPTKNKNQTGVGESPFKSSVFKSLQKIVNLGLSGPHGVGNRAGEPPPRRLHSHVPITSASFIGGMQRKKVPLGRSQGTVRKLWSKTILGAELLLSYSFLPFSPPNERHSSYNYSSKKRNEKSDMDQQIPILNLLCQTTYLKSNHIALACW